MMIRPYNTVTNCLRKVMIVLFLLSFTAGQILPAQIAFAQTASVLNLPMPGAMVGVSPSYVPISIKGIKVFPNDPFRFEFILDTGNSSLDKDRLSEETKLLVKYFLTALTIPDSDQWVNLSPYENDRIVPNEFGATEMGRDLLAQDYLLKQLTASLIYPEHELGKKFWENVYKKAYEKYGDVDIPVSTFNKVWVMPDRAKVYQHGNTAIIAESRLKVMLEEDYLAFIKNSSSEAKGKLVSESSRDNSFGSEVVREIVLPAIEKEVNEGKNFAKLRQIYHSMVMAAWYKRKLKDGILGKMYVGANKVAGVDVEDKQIKQKIYEQYLAAYKKGVYNYIKEEFDEHSQETIPRKYFSGGVVAAELDRRLQVEPLDDQRFNEEAARLDDSLTASVVAAPVDAKGSLLANVAGLTGNQQRQGTSDKAQLSNAQLDLRVFDNEVTSALKNPEIRSGKIKEIRRSVQDKIREAYASTGETEGALGYELGRLAGAAFDSIIERYDQLKDDPVQQEAYLKEAKVSFSYTVDPQTGKFQAELSNTGAGISQEILFRLQGQKADLNNTVGYDTYQVIQSLVGGAMSYNQWYEISVVSKTKGAQNAVRYTTGLAGQASVNDYYSSMETGSIITFTGRSLSRGNIRGTSDKAQLSDKETKSVQFDVPVFDQIDPASLINPDTRSERVAEIRKAVQDKVREAYASTGETRGALGYELGRLAGVAFDSIIERYDYLNGDPVKQEAYLKEAKITLSYTLDQQTGQFQAVLSDTGAGISREVLNRMSGDFRVAAQTRFFGENGYFIIQGLLGGAKYYNQWDEIAVVSRTPNASTAYRFTTGLAGQASVNDYFSAMESGTEITIKGRSLMKTSSVDKAMLVQNMTGLSNGTGKWEELKAQWEIVELIYSPGGIQKAGLKRDGADVRVDEGGNYPHWVYVLQNTENNKFAYVGPDDVRTLFGDRLSEIIELRENKETQITERVDRLKDISVLQRLLGETSAATELIKDVAQGKPGDRHFEAIDQVMEEYYKRWQNGFPGEVSLERFLDIYQDLRQTLGSSKRWSKLRYLSETDKIQMSVLVDKLNQGQSLTPEDAQLMARVHKRILDIINSLQQESFAWGQKRSVAADEFVNPRRPAYHANIWVANWLKQAFGSRKNKPLILDVGANLSVLQTILQTIAPDLAGAVVDLEKEDYPDAPNPFKVRADISNLEAGIESADETARELVSEPHNFDAVVINFVLDQLTPEEVRNTLKSLERLLRDAKDQPVVVITLPKNSPLQGSSFDRVLAELGYEAVSQASNMSNVLTTEARERIGQEEGREYLDSIEATFTGKVFHAGVYRKTVNVTDQEIDQVDLSRLQIRQGADRRKTGNGEFASFSDRFDAKKVDLSDIFAGLKETDFEIKSDGKIVTKTELSENERYAGFDSTLEVLLWVSKMLEANPALLNSAAKFKALKRNLEAAIAVDQMLQDDERTYLPEDMVVSVMTALENFNLNLAEVTAISPEIGDQLKKVQESEKIKWDQDNKFATDYDQARAQFIKDLRMRTYTIEEIRSAWTALSDQELARSETQDSGATLFGALVTGIRQIEGSWFNPQTDSVVDKRKVLVRLNKEIKELLKGSQGPLKREKVAQELGFDVFWLNYLIGGTAKNGQYTGLQDFDTSFESLDRNGKRDLIRKAAASIRSRGHKPTFLNVEYALNLRRNLENAAVGVLDKDETWESLGIVKENIQKSPLDNYSENELVQLVRNAVNRLKYQGIRTTNAQVFQQLKFDENITSSLFARLRKLGHTEKSLGIMENLVQGDTERIFKALQSAVDSLKSLGVPITIDAIGAWIEDNDAELYESGWLPGPGEANQKRLKAMGIIPADTAEDREALEAKRERVFRVVNDLKRRGIRPTMSRIAREPGYRESYLSMIEDLLRQGFVKSALGINEDTVSGENDKIFEILGKAVNDLEKNDIVPTIDAVDKWIAKNFFQHHGKGWLPIGNRSNQERMEAMGIIIPKESLLKKNDDKSMLAQTSDDEKRRQDVTVQKPDDVGGIDMNANALDLQTEGQEIKLDMPFNPAQWQNIKLDGFTPIILQINTTNLPLFIGAGEPTNNMRLSSLS